MNNKGLYEELKKSISVITEAFKKAEKEIAELRSVINLMTATDKWFDGKEVAKMLNYQGIGRNTLYAILRDANILSSENEPYQFYVDRGYSKVIQSEKNGFFHSIPVFSVKGVELIKGIIDESISYDLIK